MFLSDSHLPQILSSEMYHSEVRYRREVERLFLPGWHCIGTTAELPCEGDFLTRTLFGYPLVVWRSEGELRTFLNVCPHRFSLVCTAPSGNRERLWCPYHGWEFDNNGDTCKIPDARSFRPLEKGQLGLAKFHTETCGQLVFVSLANDPPPLEDYLGADFHRFCQTWFSDEWNLSFCYRRPNGSNWKVSLENSLEGYHNATVHRGTYQGWPDASVCTHELHDEFRSTFKVDAENEDDKAITKLGKAAGGGWPLPQRRGKKTLVLRQDGWLLVSSTQQIPAMRQARRNRRFRDTVVRVHLHLLRSRSHDHRTS